MSEQSIELNSYDYSQIISVARSYAQKIKPTLPSLPGDTDLEPIAGKMWALDKDLINAIRNHLDKWGVARDHSFYEHHEPVAVLSAYVAENECQDKGITGDLRDEIVKRTWRLGLLHDLQRWRGWQKDHQIEGMKAARQKLDELGIHDEYLEDQILLHDEMIVTPRSNPRFDIPFFSVFAVDHYNWGTEWEERRWKGLEESRTPIGEAIQDYSFMERLRDSPNLIQTKWGREVALPVVEYGLKIAQYIKQYFQ